ncbi:hypothetical protein [Dietzia sp. 179-F 9C3 NHS]|uniref:hypothetical protein n=1 Tax=Dietzia sp. 179-F 9C3 NHS TaxID=3374295 RepID=UPI00387997B0
MPTPVSPQLIVGTGPSELHAHIDLERRARLRQATGPVRLTVLSTSCCDGHWSVLAQLHPARHRR